VIIDEAHLVPKDGSGMYRSLLTALREECPDMRVCGFTATPYRLDSGRLDKGDEKMFDEVVYSYGIAEGVEDFYLAPLHSRAGKVEIDVSNVGKRGGEFIASELESAAMDENIIARAAREIVERGADRRSWLIFCTGIAHAEMVAEAIKACGVEAVAVHSKMSREARDEATTAFKEGRLRCLTNAQVLTTGFNAPTTDLIAFLRPTLSTGLYVQMMGRGTRTAPGKDNCLVLDFSGNVRRHGPVDAVRPAEKRSGSGDKNEQGVKVDEDDQRAKTCPKCEHLVLKTDIVCKYCGHEWPAPPPKHAPKPDTDVAVMTRELPRGPAGSIRCTVYAWDAFRHEKYNDPLAPPTVRIQYRAGTSYYKEWLCPEHPIGSFPRRKFFEFWDEHGGGLPIPETVEEAIKRWDELKLPAAIFVKIGDQFPKIVGRSMIDEKKTA
jgi:DNA repair protein RadD